MNGLEFKVEMMRHNDVQQVLADDIGMNIATMNKKINSTDGACFDIKEVKFFIDRWKLKPDRITEIFFKEG